MPADAEGIRIFMPFLHLLNEFMPRSKFVRQSVNYSSMQAFWGNS